MKNTIISLCKKSGFSDVSVKFFRYEFSAVHYDVIINGMHRWDGGYFIGEDGGKDSMIVSLKTFLNDISKTHGGKREGSGRKKGEPTKVIRIPEHLHEDVIKMIKQKSNAKKRA